MKNRRYHIAIGIVCLVLSIILPTFIYHYYFQIQSWNETLQFNDVNTVLSVYGGLITLGVFLFFFTLVALRELGGYMVGNLKNIDNIENDQYSA